MTARKTKSPKRDDAARKDAVLQAALAHAAFDGFSDGLLQRAGKEVGADAKALATIFPNGTADLIAEFSASIDRAMEAELVQTDFAKMRIRDRIKFAILTRLVLLRPHKEAARRAAATLSLPANAALAAKLLWQTCDLMWRGIGDTATDFNFYSKRAILIGVYSSTLVRWFNDQTEAQAETTAFLDRRIDNVMQFEKIKAQMKKEIARLPSLSAILNSVNRRPSV